MATTDPLPDSPFTATLSVSRARAIKAAIEAFDYAFRTQMRTTKPGVPSEVAGIFAAARLEMIIAYQRRLADWAGADAEIERAEDRQRAAATRPPVKLPVEAFADGSAADAARAAQDARAEAPDV